MITKTTIHLNFSCLLTDYYICCVVVQVDLFFYREPEETKPDDEDEAAPQAEYGLPAPEYGMVGGDQWTTAQIPDAAWPGEAQAPISAAPAAGSWSDSAGEFLTDNRVNTILANHDFNVLFLAFFFFAVPAAPADGGWDTAVPPPGAPAAGWE